MKTFETQFAVGDDAFFLDLNVLAPVGPIPITELTIVSGYDAGRKLEVVVTYSFRGNVKKRADEVFATHAEALAAAEAKRSGSYGAIAPPTAREFHGLPMGLPVDMIGQQEKSLTKAIGHKRTG